MKPEAALVLALARADTAGLRAFPGRSLDWNLAGELAARHQVDALCSWLWRNRIVRELGPQVEFLPVPFIDRLRQAYLHHLLRNESLLNDLERLQDSLSARGVRGLYFKGPWLAFYAYPDPGTRPIGDIDLGIPDRDYPVAIDALREIGYEPDRPLPAGVEGALRRAHYGSQLRFAGRGRRPVELHFRLLNLGPPSAGEPWIWETAREVKAGPSTILVPGAEAMLVHLLLHANQHAFSLLRLLHDIRWALERDGADLDVSRLVGILRDLRCVPSAYHALLLARDLAGASLPAGILEALRPSYPRRALFGRLWNIPAARRLEARRGRMEAESPILYLLEVGTLRDKVRYAAGVVAESGGPRAFLAKARRILFGPGSEAHR